MPSSLEPNGPSHQNPRYFSPSDVFTVLYGQNTPRHVNRDEVGTQAAGHLAAAETLYPGSFLNIVNTVSCPVNVLTKTKANHARLRANARVDHTRAYIGNYFFSLTFTALRLTLSCLQ